MADQETKTITAEELAKKQREVSISEFFTKNRHLLGFDNPIRALLMTVKELVDNSLDAIEEIRVLPEIVVEVKQVGEDRFKVSVEDNGPGIVKEQIPNVFGKLLYGSKFFSNRQSRGQQGLGVSVSVLYSQLTTGKATKVTSKTSSKRLAHYYELHINTQKNEPEIVKEDSIEWNKNHGTKVEIELEARYQKGRQSVDEYLKQAVIANPHLHLVYLSPDNTKTEFLRATKELPRAAKEIKPHPHGIELGTLMQMLQRTTAKTLQSFLMHDFCRVGANTAKEICDNAKMQCNVKPIKVTKEQVELLFKTIQSTRIIAPPTDCLSPIGQETLEKGLRKEIDAEFYTTITRPPSVYRGFPFLIEAAVVYGGSLQSDQQAKLTRFANRVPLLYQQGACAITEATTEINWRAYGLQQSSNSLPIGPAMIFVHIASVWVPFTSESKEAIAHYPEIIKEIKLALQDIGRRLASYIRKTVKAREQKERIDLFEKYIPELAGSLSSLSGEKKAVIENNLQKILKKGLKNLLTEVGEGEDEKAD